MRPVISLAFPPKTSGFKTRIGLPPLGILYLASLLENQGFDVRIVDGEMQGSTPEEMATSIWAQKPILIGISMMTCQVVSGGKLARELKARIPSVPICAGGAHINATMGEILRMFTEIDFAIHGEAEQSFSLLAEAVKNGTLQAERSRLRGLVYRTEDGHLHVNPPPPRADNLDELPFPAFHLVPLDQYWVPYAKSRPIIPVMVGRGCPYRCTFCDVHTTWGRKVRLRSPRNVVQEIEASQIKYGAMDFTFKDSTFTISRDWCIRFFEELNKRRIKINWRCNTRVDLVDKNLLGRMKAAGCSMIQYGVESGSQKVLDALKKGVTLEQIRRAHNLTRKAGITIFSSFMIGNPLETEKDILSTMRFAREIRPDVANFFYTTAYPGTELYQWGIRHNVIALNWWKNAQEEGCDKIIQKWVADGVGGQLIQGREERPIWVKKAYRDFYLNPGQLFRLLKMLIRQPYYLKAALVLVPDYLRFAI